MKKGMVIWLFGLPCSGKTTLAELLVKDLDAMHLDGDSIRKTINYDLGFSDEDRLENLTRIAKMSKYFSDNGTHVVCSFITPLESQRREIETLVGSKLFWVYVNAPKDVCIERDVKGMWAKALKGEIKNFTGVDAPFEDPTDVDIEVDALLKYPTSCITQIYGELNKAMARVMYIGRWQPLHDGHKYIIKKALDDDQPVLICVRDMLPDMKNPYSAEEVKANLEDFYKDDDVEVLIIPDIQAVAYGRGVGYGVYEIEVPEKIKDISATEIREKMKNENKND